GTYRGRLGFVAGNWLLYGTGGVAFGHDRTDRVILQSQSPAFIGERFRATGWDTGWVAGGGVEWMIAPKWSVKIEYQHLQFDDVDRDFLIGTTPAGVSATASRHTVTDVGVDTVRIGFNAHLSRETPSQPLK